MPTRYFTLAEAQALVPRVRALMSQALQLHAHLRTSVGRLGENGQEISWPLLRGEIELEGSSAGEREQLQRARMIYQALRESVTDVEKLGAEVKAVMEGLVDFPSWRDGHEEVVLCWKLGETEIGWWHDLESGFGNRQPIAGHEFTAEPAHSSVEAAAST